MRLLIDDKYRNVPDEQVQQQMLYGQRGCLVLEHEIEHDQHAEQTGECAERQRRASRTGERVGAAQHLPERACALAGQESGRSVALGVARVEQTGNARRVGLVGDAAAQIEFLLDPPGKR